MVRTGGLASYDLSQPGTVDANFAGRPQLTLAPEEGGRGLDVSSEDELPDLGRGDDEEPVGRRVGEVLVGLDRAPRRGEERVTEGGDRANLGRSKARAHHTRHVVEVAHRLDVNTLEEDTEPTEKQITLSGGAILPVYSFDLGLANISPKEKTMIPASTTQPVPGPC